MTDWVKMQISHISRDGTQVTLGSRDYTAAPGLMSEFQNREFIEVQTNGNTILDARFPADMNPKKPAPEVKPVTKGEETVKTGSPQQVKPNGGGSGGGAGTNSVTSQTPGPAPKTVPVSQEVQQSQAPPVQQQKQPAPLKPVGTPYNNKGYLRGLQIDPAKEFYGFSLERIKDGKGSGDVEFFSLKNNPYETELIEGLKTLQKDQQVDYITISYKPIAIGPQGSLNKKRDGTNYKSDPIVDLIRNFSILNESLFDKSLQWKISCIEHGINPQDEKAGWNEIISRAVEASNEIYTRIDARIRGGK